MAGGSIVGLQADPLLIEAGAAPALKPEELRNLKAYRLRAGSPCLGAGIPLPEDGGRDFWGDAPPEGAKPNIGASQQP